MHSKLIEKIINNGNNKDMLGLKDILNNLLDNLKINDFKQYNVVSHKLYKLVYGDKLSEDLAKKWVKSMKNKDNTTGEHWSYEQTSNFANEFDKNEWYAVMNMMYSDYYNPKFDTDTYIELAKDWFNDKDSSKSKTIDYFFDIVKLD